MHTQGLFCGQFTCFNFDTSYSVRSKGDTGCLYYIQRKEQLVMLQEMQLNVNHRMSKHKQRVPQM